MTRLVLAIALLLGVVWSASWVWNCCAIPVWATAPLMLTTAMVVLLAGFAVLAALCDL